MKLLKQYQNMVIWRQAIIMMIAAPVPAAVIKLQGSILDSQTIASIIIITNIFSMLSYILNKRLGAGALFISGNIVSAVAVGAILTLWVCDADPKYAIILFPILSALGFMLVGLAGSKITNLMKDKYGDELDLSVYESKKSSVMSASAIIGQGLAVGFYAMDLGVSDMTILVVLETANCIVYALAEVQRWALVKKMEIL